jgi:hypothetical protein
MQSFPWKLELDVIQENKKVLVIFKMKMYNNPYLYA